RNRSDEARSSRTGRRAPADRSLEVTWYRARTWCSRNSALARCSRAAEMAALTAAATTRKTARANRSSPLLTTNVWTGSVVELDEGEGRREQRRPEMSDGRRRHHDQQIKESGDRRPAVRRDGGDRRGQRGAA